MTVNKYKHIRDCLNLSQREMARLLGISRGGYAMVETGKRAASDDVELRFNVIKQLAADNVYLVRVLKSIKETPWWKKPFIKIELTFTKENICGRVVK